MIIEGIFTVIFGALKIVLNLLPTIDISMPTGFFTWFTQIVSASAYFLPLVDFFVMMGIWFAVVNFQIIWKTIQRIWDALPFT